MKKRIRKKLHKREFQQLGFNIEFDYAEANDDDLYCQFWDSFISEAIEGNGLECGGGGDVHQEYFATRYNGSVSDEQRFAVKKWLEEHPKVSNVVMGELRDAWYGWD